MGDGTERASSTTGMLTLEERVAYLCDVVVPMLGDRLDDLEQLILDYNTKLQITLGKYSELG